MKKLSFYNRIILGFALIFIIMLCKTFFVIIQLRNINKTMDTLYEHPYKVSNAVKEFNTEILKSYINLRDIRYFDTPQQLDSLKNKVSESEKMIDNQLIIITQRYLGNKIDVDSITGDLSEWKRLTEQTFQIKKTTSVDNLVLFLTKDVRQQVYKIMKHSAAINAFASKRAETFMKNIIAAENKTLNTLYILLIVISIIAFTLSHFLSKSISKPIKEFARKAVSIFSIQTKNKNYSTENEEDLLTFTLKELEYSYQNIEQQNEEIKSSNEQLFEINKNLEEKTKNLKETNQSLEEMVYITSHDLQAPLVSMEGYATELLKDYADKFDEEGYYCLTRLQSNARRMHHLVLSLLDISRLNTKKNQYEKFKLKLIIEKVMMDLTLTIEKHKANIIIQTLPELYADRQRIEIVFRNLISNALNYEGKNIIVGFDENIIFVKDDGIGIPKNQLEKIFYPGERLKLNKAEGVGMGLTFCKKVIEQHQGIIWAVSQGENKGTTINIKFT